MRKSIKITLTILSGIVSMFFFYVYFSTYHPAEIQVEPVYNRDNAPLLQSGESIKILSWNIQFLAGNENNYFFFDGGTDPWPGRNVIKHTLDEVVRVLIDEDPDIILLQEVDDGSARTFNEDQLERILDLLPDSFGCHTSAVYWKAWFIPHSAIMGSAGMKLSIISKYRIDQAIRHALPPITTDNIIIRQFNPKRTMLEAKIPISGGRHLSAINTHLSAFAQGCDTMEKQVALVDQLLTQIEQRKEIGFIAGDFNLIPPGKAYDRLSDFNKRYYHPNGTEIAVLFHKYFTIPTIADLNGDDYEKWYTNMATNADPKAPDKTIDYFVFSKSLQPDSHYVRSGDTVLISDHLPLIIKLTVPE